MLLSKTPLLVLLCAVVYNATANPAAGTEWRWKNRHLTVSPNVLALPFNHLIRTYVPKVRIPGATVVKNCGRRKRSSERIVGGTEAPPHAYPWMVALFVDYEWFCAGTLISPEWILTAAHCMKEGALIEIVLGAHNLQEAEEGQLDLSSTEYIIHDWFDPTTALNDIALIHLGYPLPETDEIRPICLPSYSDPAVPVGTEVALTGWGYTSDEPTDLSVGLQVLNSTVLENMECATVYGGIITDAIVCADGTNGRICRGDDGGPMNTAGTCDCPDCIVTRGVMSFGPSDSCETASPSGFTRVSDYLEWIAARTGIAIGD